MKSSKDDIKRIAIIGPESTGKSTLCKQLAEHYNTEWVPEFAREYLEEKGMNYSYDDLLTIAKEQLDLEDQYYSMLKEESEENMMLFIDTNMYVMKVWCEFVFGKCHHWIIDQIVERKYDLYLLCNIDLPWVPDKLREYPDLARREQLYRIYKDLIINQPTPWVDISGDSNQRFQKAIDAVSRLL